MRTRRAGIALVELVVVVLLVVIAARIAMPFYTRAVLQDRAAVVLEEIETVRTAAAAYFADHDRWPPDADRGVTPPELVPHLPEGFSFRGNGYALDWDHWTLPDGMPGDPETGVLVGVSLAVDDEALERAVLSLVDRSTVRFAVAGHHTFLIADEG